MFESNYQTWMCNLCIDGSFYWFKHFKWLCRFYLFTQSTDVNIHLLSKMLISSKPLHRHHYRCIANAFASMCLKLGWIESKNAVHFNDYSQQPQSRFVDAPRFWLLPITNLNQNTWYLFWCLIFYRLAGWKPIQRPFKQFTSTSSHTIHASLCLIPIWIHGICT